MLTNEEIEALWNAPDLMINAWDYDWDETEGWIDIPWEKDGKR